jgi:hypothetical protein
MNKWTDILLDDDGDLLLDGEEPMVGDTTVQNQNLLLQFNKGDLKLYPLVGVGVHDFIEDDTTANLAREVRQQFRAEGLTINKIKINGSQIEIDARYL